jgi:hypothetical protein
VSIDGGISQSTLLTQFDDKISRNFNDEATRQTSDDESAQGEAAGFVWIFCLADCGAEERRDKDCSIRNDP